MTDKLLGSGHNTAYIFDRTGESQLMKVSKSTSIKWSRSLSGISTAELVIAADDCTPQLDRFHPWAHSLVVMRDPGTGAPPRRAWEGPIRRRVDPTGGGPLTVTASDVLGWTERRPCRVARKLASAAAVAEVEWALNHAYELDDPNVLAYIQQIGTNDGGSVSRDLAPLATMMSEDLSSLAGAGAAYTVLGRSVLFFADVTLLGRTPVLAPEDHLLAEVEVTEDGDLLATQVIAADDNGGRRSAGGVDSYYGLVSSMVSVGGTKRRAGLTRRAEALLAQSYPQPLTINVPQNAQLRPDAPFPIELLVPGVLVPLQVTTATGRTISADFVLTTVEVTQAAGGEEQVSITLGPVTEGAAVPS